MKHTRHPCELEPIVVEKTAVLSESHTAETQAAEAALRFEMPVPQRTLCTHL